MSEIRFVTGNIGKFEEAKLLIEGLVQLDVDLPEIQSLDPEAVIEAKLMAAKEHYSGPMIVEDSSVCLEGLNGFPGPLIKWMVESVGVEGVYRLTEDIGNPTVSAEAVIGYYDGKQGIHYFKGSVSGKIVPPSKEPRNGFGWDGIFMPDGYDVSFAGMDAELKAKISHRTMALQGLSEFLGSS